MKKIYLVHGWGGTGSGGWFDWIKEEMKEKAEVISFNMPNTEKPEIEKWVRFLKENIKDLDEETYFIGHSIGCQTILRFLEKESGDVNVGGCVFVAGFLNQKEDLILSEEENRIIRPWLERPIDFEQIKKNCKKFLCLFSDNDPLVSVKDSNIFKEKLEAEIIIKKNHEHFNQVAEIPEILEFIED